MSAARKHACAAQSQRRWSEWKARCGVAAACRSAQSHGVPTARVLRKVGLADRTARRWGNQKSAPAPVLRGRKPRCASRAERNEVYRFLRERGGDTPTSTAWAAFPKLRQVDISEQVQRYRRVMRRRRDRHQSRLEWQQPGTVWAADFKERREPLEGRYGWILAVQDLSSRCQLAWLPVAEATAEVVQAAYARLFAAHGPPLVLKADNGGPFRADDTKQLLESHGVVPLFSPKRRPQYNGGIERANRQLAGYQEAQAEFHRRPAGPTRADAAAALRLANELARPWGWTGSTAGELFAARTPISEDARQAFRSTVDANRATVLAAWGIRPDAMLSHATAAARDRRAVRDALVSQGLLQIVPRSAARRKNSPAAQSAGILQLATNTAPPNVGDALVPGRLVAASDQTQSEAHHSSTHKTSASGQN